eukprot:s2135_g8.t1
MFFGDHVPEAFTKVWARHGKKHVICQAEMFPVLVAKCTWSDRLALRSILRFMDNESARMAFVRNFSPVIDNFFLLQVNSNFDVDLQSRIGTAVYLQSQTNPSDDASRLDFSGYVNAMRCTPCYDRLKRSLSDFESLRRLVVESHALALSDLQRKVEAPTDASTATRKLPVAERQTRQKEQEEKLEGIIFSPEVTPSHALVDSCVNMLEQSVLTWIKPEECTSRAQEIQSLKKDSKVAIDADGNIKVSSKAATLSCSVTSELDLRNAFQRRSLAMDQAKLCSFREIEKWVQHLFLSHERSQPPGFASVTLQQIIECDKQMFIRASNNLVGNLQSEPGAKETPLDTELQTLRTSPELMPYLMPMQAKSALKPSPNPNQPTKRLQQNGKGNPNKYRKGKGKGKGTGKGKSKTGGLDLPPGCVAKTPDGKPLCFAFNRGVCGFTGPRCQRGFHLCFKQNCHKPKPYHECSHSSE